MVPSLPLVEAPNLWLILTITVAAAAALGAWVAKLEAAYTAARPLAPVDREPEAAPDLRPAAAA